MHDRTAAPRATAEGRDQRPPAAADAQELDGAFAIPAAQVRIHMAGGMPTGVGMPGDVEDDAAGPGVALAGLCARDAVIVVLASGTTVSTLAAAQAAGAAGATVGAIANNPGAPLFPAADQPIPLATPPEAPSGWGRMGWGRRRRPRSTCSRR